MISRTIIYITLCCFSIQVHGQQSLSDLDRKEVRYKKVRRFVKRQVKNQCDRLCDIKSTTAQLVEVEFITHEQVLSTNLPLNLLWESYVHSDPVDTWNDKKQSIALMIDENDQKIHYPDELESKICKGQIYYYNLRILGRFFQLAVAFEITNVDHENHAITYSYIEGGKTIGTQTFRLIPTENGGTTVYHSTDFSTGSLLRSRFLYPYFHTKLIKSMHNRVWDYTYEELASQ